MSSGQQLQLVHCSPTRGECSSTDVRKIIILVSIFKLNCIAKIEQQAILDAGYSSETCVGLYSVQLLVKKL
jgi:hypothetical protein